MTTHETIHKACLHFAQFGCGLLLHVHCTRFELNSSNGLYIIDECTTREMQCRRNIVRALRLEASSQYHQLWCAVSCQECPVSFDTPYSLPPLCSLDLCGCGPGYSVHCNYVIVKHENNDDTDNDNDDDQEYNDSNNDSDNQPEVSPSRRRIGKDGICDNISGCMCGRRTMLVGLN